jgi:hypothetical protein
MGAGDKLLGGELAKVPTYGGFRYVQLGADLGHRQSPVLGQQFQQDTPALSSVFGIRGSWDGLTCGAPISCHDGLTDRVRPCGLM